MPAFLALIRRSSIKR